MIFQWLLGCLSLKKRLTLLYAFHHVVIMDVIINLVLMVVVLDKNVTNIIFVIRVTVDAGYMMTVIKRVPIMDIINGLTKRIIPDQ